MGARVYIPGIGRFLQVDPVEGGVDNNYVYPTDPVNEFDLTGEFAFLAPAAVILGRIAVQAAVRYGPTALRYSGHALKRMAQRNISKKTVEKTLKEGIRYKDSKHPKTIAYVLKLGGKSGKSIYVSVGKNRKVITVIKKVFRAGKCYTRL
jgi:hypothetical protein